MLNPMCRFNNLFIVYFRSKIIGRFHHLAFAKMAR